MLEILRDLFIESIIVRGLVYGLGFALIEIIFTTFAKDSDDGGIHFAFGPLGRTTWIMIPGSILGGTVIIENFYHFTTPFLLRVFLWPLVIWLIEILWGGFLFYGCNGKRAWYYEGNSAKINGFIKLSYYPFWLILGLGIELSFFLIGMN